MRYPNFNEEKKLWKKGYNMVVGIDEAGRGPLAGPVVAAAVAVNPKFKIKNSKQITNYKPKNPNLFRISDLGFRILAKEVKDSKLLSEKKREKLFEIIAKCPLMGWGIGRVSEKVIDKINILEATKLAMMKAVKSLESKLKKEKKLKIDYLLIDGNFRIYSDMGQKSIIKGDQKVFSIAAASIIAKVYRDKIMRRYHKKYPQYAFDVHKGYPTKSHCMTLEKYGPCEIHRKTFYPVKKYY
jgi:ribonuclease HII